MNESTVQEYDDQLVALLEAVWGEGFMSPGGVEEVDRYLNGLELAGKSVLDIGCGLGGVDIHLVKNHQSSRVIGIDIEQPLIDRCNTLAQKYKLDERIDFICIRPGKLGFEDHSFDIVTSKDSIIHIPDKYGLAADIFRVLKPGGWFAASDWLAGYDGQPSAAMQAYLDAEGLDFGLASANTYRQALEQAGFTDITIVDRNEWYRQQARKERDCMRSELYAGLKSKLGTDFVERQIDVWDKMIVALDEGQLRPTHLRGRKPV